MFLRLVRVTGFACAARRALFTGCSVLADAPLDLHVLGTPPAFILSQDQTLKLILERFFLAEKTLCVYSSALPNQVQEVELLNLCCKSTFNEFLTTVLWTVMLIRYSNFNVQPGLPVCLPCRKPARLAAFGVSFSVTA